MFFIIAAIITVAFKTLSNKESERINDLFIKNIECLATPENPNIRCFGNGSLDCPGHNLKVIYYG